MNLVSLPLSILRFICKQELGNREIVGRVSKIYCATLFLEDAAVYCSRSQDSRRAIDLGPQVLVATRLFGQ